MKYVQILHQNTHLLNTISSLWIKQIYEPEYLYQVRRINFRLIFSQVVPK